MDDFREFVLSHRVQHFAIALPLQLLVNSAAMWIVVNRIEDLGEKTPLWRCALCAGLLYAVTALAVAMLLVPFPLVFFLSAAIWLVGSIAVIRTTLQLLDGGISIFVMYLMFLGGIHIVVKMSID